MMRTIITFLLIALLLAVSTVSADTDFTGGGDGSSWSDGSNWSEGVPVGPDTVIIDTQPGSDVVINTGTNAVGNLLYVGDATWDTLPGGGIDSNAYDTLTVNSGATYVANSLTAGSIAYVYTGSTLYVNGFFRPRALYVNYWGNVEISVGQVIIDSGWWYVTGNSKMTIKDGGIFRVATVSQGGVPVVSGTPNWASPTSQIDIAGGEMQFRGDVRTELETAVDNDWIIADGGESDVIITYDPASLWAQGATFVTAGISPYKASSPAPSSGQDVYLSPDRTIQLNWQAGLDVISHKVYFGTEPNNLSLMATQPEAEYTVSSLDIDETYYWRIDEVDPMGGSDIEGPIWVFQTKELSIYGYDCAWTAAGDRTNWSDPDNWFPRAVPLATDDIEIAVPDSVVTISEDTDAVGNNVYLGLGTVSGHGLVVKGTFDGRWLKPSLNPTFVVEEGADFAVQHWYQQSYYPPQINGGTVRVKFPCGWFIRQSPVKLNDGMIRVENGSEDISPFDIVIPPGILDIARGNLVVDGNHVTELQDQTVDGGIVAYGGEDYGQLDIVYDSDSDTTIVSATDLRQAYDPLPADKAANISKNTEFDWMMGDGTKTVQGNEVYLGTDKDAVTIADSGSDEYQGVFDLPQDFDPSPLLENVTYYWRVDQIMDANDLVVKGNVWEFTTSDCVNPGMLGGADFDGNCMITLGDFAGIADVWMDPGVFNEGFEDYASEAALDAAWQVWPTTTGTTSVSLQTTPANVFEGSQSMHWTYDNPWPGSPSGIWSEIYTVFSQSFDVTSQTRMRLMVKVHLPGIPVPYIFYVKALEGGTVPGNEVNAALIYDSDLQSPYNMPESWFTWDIDLGSIAAQVDDMQGMIIGCVHAGQTEISYGSGTVSIDRINIYNYGEKDLDEDGWIGVGDLQDLASFWQASGKE